MTPGEPPAQLDDRWRISSSTSCRCGESSSSAAASRTLPVGSAGRLGLCGLVPQLCRDPVNQVLVGTQSDPAGALSS
jgi:hypothetical protein